MTLRIHGPGQPNKLVQIRSPKCTIGAAAGCTLRLVASGVEPLHCWVLRGPGGAVIRRLHGAAAINDKRVEESLIRPGDRLRLGSVELEFVELSNESGGPEPAGTNGTLAPIATNTAELEARLAGALDQLERLEGQARQGFQASITAAERADQLRDALAAADQQLEESSRELAAAQQAATQRAAELEALRRQLGNQQELLAQLEQAHRESEGLSNDQARIQNELGQMRLTLQSEQAAWQAKEQSWQAERSSWENEKSNWQAERSNWATEESNRHAERSSWQAECTLLEQRLAQRDAELAAVRESAQAQSSIMTVPLPGVIPHDSQSAARCAELTAQLAEREREIDQLRQQVTTEQQRWAESQAALAAGQAADDELRAREVQLASQSSAAAEREAQLADRAASLAAQAAELEATQQRLARECAQLRQDADQFSQTQQQLEQGQQQFRTERQQFETERQQFETERQQWLARQAELDARQAELIGRQAELDRQAAELAEREQAIASPVAAPPPSQPPASNDHEAESNPRDSRSVDSVLSRLMQAGVWRQDGQENEDDKSGGAARETVVPPTGVEVAEASDEIHSEPRRPLAATPPAAGDDEESIESYMQRLMQRVRGDGTDTANSAPATPQRWQPAAPAPVEQKPAPAPVAVAAVSEIVDPSQYVPRSMAPELGAGLSAMRELANSAARSAIDQHIRRRTQAQATGKLFGACLSLSAGLVLWYWAWKTRSFTAASAAALGCTLGGSWVIAALRRVIKVRQRNQQDVLAQAVTETTTLPGPESQK